MKSVIEISHLCKHFGDIRAVDDLSFRVQEGELFAFLGVNGAGKSTTINILCAALQKDSGQVLVNGMNIDTDSQRIKRSLGVVFQDSLLDKPLSVQDNLFCRAALYGITGDRLTRRMQELTELLDLEPLLRRPIGQLSGGQRRRIDIARALLHEPRILVLDEPTTGLDPQTRTMIWQTITDLRTRTGMTVFLTTHYMEEAAEADHVVILDSGRIAAEGTPLELKNAYTGDFITLYGIGEADVNTLGRPFSPVRDGFRISVPDTKAATDLILRYPALFCDYEITKGKMDDVFLAVTGKACEGGETK